GAPIVSASHSAQNDVSRPPENARTIFPAGLPPPSLGVADGVESGMEEPPGERSRPRPGDVVRLRDDTRPRPPPRGVMLRREGQESRETAARGSRTPNLRIRSP